MKHVRPNPSGLTLVEVLLAMAIMAMVLAALTQMQDNGVRAAVGASVVAEAAVLCQSEMDAWLAGNRSQAALDIIELLPGAEPWSRRLSLQPAPAAATGVGLSVLTVEIFRGNQREPQFKLSRWVASRGQGRQP